MGADDLLDMTIAPRNPFSNHVDYSTIQEVVLRNPPPDDQRKKIDKIDLEDEESVQSPLSDFSDISLGNGLESSSSSYAVAVEVNVDEIDDRQVLIHDIPP